MPVTTLKLNSNYLVVVNEYGGGWRFDLRTIRKMWDNSEVQGTIGYFDIRPDPFCCGRGHAGHWCIDSTVTPELIQQWLAESVKYWMGAYMHGCLTATLATATREQWSDDINVIRENISQKLFLAPLEAIGFKAVSCYKSPKTGDGIVNFMYIDSFTPNYTVN